MNSMTAKQFDTTPNGPVKKQGWFSWRHETDAAHRAASDRFGIRHGRERRREEAEARQSIHAASGATVTQREHDRGHHGNCHHAIKPVAA